MRLTCLLVLALTLAACGPEQRPAAPGPAPPEADTTIVAEPAEAPPDTAARTPEPSPDVSDEGEKAPAEEEAAEEVEQLYVRTDAELRQSFADALFSLYRMEADPAETRRLSRGEVLAWLEDLEGISPRSVALARQEVGDVLERGAAVGLLYPDAHPSDCATERDLLFIAVPESMQGETRPYDGLIVRDACDVPEGSLCTTCIGGAGTRPDGTRCSCVCTTGECPGASCVSC